MKNFLLTIRFLGTNYHGFQVQKNAVTVCEKVQDAIETVTGIRSDVKGCSRTDSGVHAYRYCLNFHSDTSLSEEDLVRALNANLPFDISATDCSVVPDDFHARYSVKSKEYIYMIYNSKKRDPFWEGRAYRYVSHIDEKLLNRSAKMFCGTHDFSAFCAAGSDMGNKTRTVQEFTVERREDLVIFRICADGFLYNMVRILVGTLLHINEGKISLCAIRSLIDDRDRSKCGPTVPPEGLYLNQVNY